MPPRSPLDLKLVSCKEKLVNLTRQNNLLFYRKRKTSSLVVKPTGIQPFYNDLLNEKRFDFWEIPEDPVKEQDGLDRNMQPALFEEKNPTEVSSTLFA